MPVRKLHARTIAALQPIGGARTDYRDSVVPGLVLRVSPTGTRTWVVVYGRGQRGEKAWLTLGRDSELDLAAAREAAARFRAEARIGKDPIRTVRAARRRPELTVKDLAERYVLEMARTKALRPKTYVEYKRILDVDIVPALGELGAAEVTRADVRELLRRIARRAPIAANRVFGMVRRLYSWAVAEDLVVGSPCVGMKKPSPEETGERVLSREELRALQEALDQLPSQSSDVVRLLLLTGVRLRMVLGMRRDELQDVDEEVAPGRAPARARWIVAGGYGGRSKNRRSHVTPLSTAALAIVRRRLELTPAHCEFLFPNRASRKRAAVWLSSYVRRLERRLQRCLNAARAEREPPEPAAVVPDWTVHELRHTVRTHLREQLHVRGDVAELIVGHVRRGVQGIYDRSELLPERRAALEAWAAWLAAVKAERPAKVLGFPLAPPDTENAGGL